MKTYRQETVDSRNPFVRFAHRTRMKRSLALAKTCLPPGEKGSVLDYGCGTGHFLELLKQEGPMNAYGYEPFMTERVDSELCIRSSLDELADHQYDLITCFEVVEHLDDHEFVDFMAFVDNHLTENGKLLVSMPIEVGPAIVLKDARRAAANGWKLGYGVPEFLRAAILGIAGRRAVNRKCSHRGFDFRAAMRLLDRDAFRIIGKSYSPFRFWGWYGNSQVFVSLSRRVRATHQA